MEHTAQTLIDEVLRPLIEADGGRIDLLDVRDNKVVIRLSGTCSGCPGRGYTLDGIVVPALRRALGDSIIVECDET